MESTPPFLSNLDCDLSSGYLQDALFKFNSKRRRLLLFDDDDEEKENYQINDSNNSIKVQLITLIFFAYLVSALAFE